MHALTRRITTYIAREHLFDPVEYRIIASVIGVTTAQGACNGHLKFKKELAAYPFLKAEVEAVIYQLHGQGVLP